MRSTEHPKQTEIMKYKLIAAAWLLLTTLLLVSGFILPPQYDETFMGELGRKTTLLEQTAGKRIVLVGGSATAFGVDSQCLENVFPDYHVVNFGLYGAAGTATMMELSLPRLRKGDIVILMPEQTQYTLTDSFDTSVLWQGLDGHPSLIFDLDFHRKQALVEGFPAFAIRKLRFFLTRRKPESDGVYKSSSFNASGDIDASLASCNVMPGMADTTTLIQFDPDLPDDEFIRQVSDYAKILKQKGVRLMFMTCPMNALAISEDELLRMDAFYENLQEQLDIPLAGNPHESILDAAWFYDTNFHLNSSGKQIYTRVIAESVKAMTGDTSRTEILTPAPPPAQQEENFCGDDSDADCFLYSEMNGGDFLAISGLTETGRTRRTLIVPSMADGKHIHSILSGALKDAQQLEEIRLQENIRLIEDEAFAGCAGLKRIVLDQTSPSRIMAGRNLLGGTHAVLLVPEDCADTYRTNYTWALYSTRIQEK